MLRIIEYLLGIALLNNLTKIHEDDMVSNALSLTQRMGHHDDGIVLLQLYKKILDSLAADRVKGTRRLISQQIAGFYSQRAGQTETLLLSARKFAGRGVQSVLHLIPQSYSLQIVLYHKIQFTLVTNTMNATAIGNVVIDTHG